MLDWKHINSAPCDGTEFLAYDVLTKKFDVCQMVELIKGKWIPEPVQADGEWGPWVGDFGYRREGIKLWAPLEPPDLTPSIDTE